MSFTDNVYPITPPLTDLNATVPQETFDPQAIAPQAQQDPDGGQAYDSAQAMRILELLRELGRADNDPVRAAEIEAELADLGISEPMGQTTPQLVAQLMGMDDYAQATQESVTEFLDLQGVELPENFWSVGLDQNWQVLQSIVAENSREQPPVRG
jgi:hypothetical protein